MSELATFLYARPSAIEGAGRILDFGDTLTWYNYSMSPQQADYLAMLADWRLVGMDMKQAIEAFGQERQQQSQIR